MKKARAVSGQNKSLAGEFITFPGYAGILFGWLGVILFAVLGVIAMLHKGVFETRVVIDAVPAAANDSGVIGQSFAVFLGIIAIIAMICALWIYVAKWTKLSVACAAKIFKVKAKNYWAFCTGLLVAGWLLVAGLSMLLNNEDYTIGVAFMAAFWIVLGSASFGLAAIKKLAPQEFEPHVKKSRRFKFKQKTT